jgi:hypothetical protein
MQIGRQCIRDFIGYDVTTITESAKWLSGLEPSESDGEEGYGGFSGKTRDIQLATYLAHVHACIRKCGFVSSKDSEIRGTQRTSSMAIQNMFPLPRARHLSIPLIAQDHEIAEQAVAWVRGINRPRDDYEYKLTVVAAENFITHRELGLAASMVPGLFRHQEQAIKRADRVVSFSNSQHIGVVGERLFGVEATMCGYNSFESKYGATHLYRLRTPNGNVLTWFASSAQALAIGDQVQLDGTVKKHDEHQEIRQTVLTRCKISVLSKKEAG